MEMTNSPESGAGTECIAALVRFVYRPIGRNAGWRLERLVGHDRIRYVSHARDALWLVLTGAGVGHGDRVLLPAFICQDLVPVVQGIGATPVYYPLGHALQPAGDAEPWLEAKAIVAVNYFGFAQDLEPFRAYCARTGALLIEDNAHGLLSRDVNGRPLGTRGDVGLFSLRKTLPLQDGAALVINDVALAARLSLPEVSGPAATSWRWRLKNLARKLVPVVGVRGLRAIIAAGRLLRGALPRRSWRSPQQQAETSWQPSAPYADFQQDLARTDPVREAARRRELYQWLHEYLHAVPCTPVFDALDAHTVPYGYPFHAEPEHMPQIRRHLARVGLDCFSWPDLPGDVRATGPDWYKNIWCVQFLW